MEVYTVIADYSQKDWGEISLMAGSEVAIIDKSETGNYNQDCLVIITNVKYISIYIYIDTASDCSNIIWLVLFMVI